MLFNSIHFACFFAVVVALHFLLSQRYRWMLLLVASCYFYMAFIPEYVLVLWAAIIIDYSAGILIESAPRTRRKILLLVSILANVGLLAFFKYFNFANENISALANVLGWNYGIQNLSIILPIGLSFHTFQGLSYTIEVYLGRQKAERHFGIYALYVMFFPQLVAGPIERPQNMLHQFHAPAPVVPERVASGLKLMLWGLFKKVAVADLVASVVATVYAEPSKFTGPILITATVFFAIQIYCDFSGYSDIAIGAARLLGYDLMINFRQPYFSRSLSEFWGRWHISLSTWFRDYVYIPLGGNRVSPPRRHFNLLVVFMISGLWHGAAWTFVIWGAVHGILLVLSQSLGPVRASFAQRLKLSRVPRITAVAQTLWICFLVSTAWVFFRAESVSDAVYILTHAHVVQGFRIEDLFALGLPRFELMIAFLMIGVVLTVDWLLAHRPAFILTAWSHRPIRWASLATCVYGVVFFGVFDKVTFIYFQF